MKCFTNLQDLVKTFGTELNLDQTLPTHFNEPFVTGK